MEWASVRLEQQVDPSGKFDGENWIIIKENVGKFSKGLEFSAKREDNTRVGEYGVKKDTPKIGT